MFFYYAFLCVYHYYIIFPIASSVGESPRLRHHVDDVEARIVGGVAAAEKRYPSIVLLSDEDKNNECAGSLILPNVVLTAAHCEGHIRIAQIGVDNRLLSFTTPGVQTYNIEKKVVHPRYIDTGSDCDFLLLKLSGSSDVTPTKLNDDAYAPAATSVVTAVGWGAMKEGGYMSATLNQVNLNVISQRSCYQIYGTSLTDNMLCASAPGKDACQGDSGGPLYIKGSTSDLDVLVGVVSWGVGCAEAKYPGVYSRVASSDAVDWLKKEACKLSGIEPCSLTFSSNSTSNTDVGSIAAATPVTVSSGNTGSLSSKNNCKDAVSFKGLHGVERTCDWVDDSNATKKKRRCQAYKDQCPLACKDLYPSEERCD